VKSPPITRRSNRYRERRLTANSEVSFPVFNHLLEDVCKEMSRLKTITSAYPGSQAHHLHTKIDPLYFPSLWASVSEGLK
jgi:hypothetical protein